MNDIYHYRLRIKPTIFEHYLPANIILQIIEFVLYHFLNSPHLIDHLIQNKKMPLINYYIHSYKVFTHIMHRLHKGSMHLSNLDTSVIEFLFIGKHVHNCNRCSNIFVFVSLIFL